MTLLPNHSKQEHKKSKSSSTSNTLVPQANNNVETNNKQAKKKEGKNENQMGNLPSLILVKTIIYKSLALS